MFDEFPHESALRILPWPNTHPGGEQQFPPPEHRSDIWNLACMNPSELPVEPCSSRNNNRIAACQRRQCQDRTDREVAPQPRRGIEQRHATRIALRKLFARHSSQNRDRSSRAGALRGDGESLVAHLTRWDHPTRLVRPDRENPRRTLVMTRLVMN